MQRLRRLVWAMTGGQGKGVLAVPLTAEGRLVLVRLTYARGWRLPGGGVGRGEGPLEAVLRELGEEIGMTGHGAVACIDEWESNGSRGASSVFLVRDVRYEPRRTWEVEEVAEFDPDSLPEGTMPLTRLKIADALELVRRA